MLLTFWRLDSHYPETVDHFLLIAEEKLFFWLICAMAPRNEWDYIVGIWIPLSSLCLEHFVEAKAGLFPNYYVPGSTHMNHRFSPHKPCTRTQILNWFPKNLSRIEPHMKCWYFMFNLLLSQLEVFLQIIWCLEFFAAYLRKADTI